jgi:hypothetical protein
MYVIRTFAVASDVVICYCLLLLRNAIFCGNVCGSCFMHLHCKDARHIYLSYDACNLRIL